MAFNSGIIFVTDSPNQYQLTGQGRRILFSGSQIQQSDFLAEEEIISINFSLSGAEIEAGERAVEELQRLVAGFDYTNVSFSGDSAETPEIELYSYLFNPLTKYGLARFQLEMLLEKIGELKTNTVFQLDLGAEYAWFKNEHPEINCVVRPEHPKTSVLRKLAALVNFQTRRQHLQNRKRLMIVSYNIGHHLEIFRPFIQYTCAHSSDVDFDIVILDFFENEDFKPENYVGKVDSRVRFHRFRDFKTRVRSENQQLLTRVISQYPALEFLKSDASINARNLQQSWMEKCLQTLRPSATFICNVHEIGRIMSESARKMGIPSIQVDYGLFSDHHIMNSSMHFSLRACLGDATKKVWESRHDRSDRVVPIGFLKLDESKLPDSEFSDKTGLWKQFGMNPERPTVFFASTWAGSGEIYDLEKKHLCSYLSEFCAKNNFNFLVKLHPLEAADDLKKLILPESGQQICTHSELNLNDALNHSDIIITQGSSVVVESLYYNKWPVFMGVKESKQLILAGMTNEDDISYFVPGKEFEYFVDQSLNSLSFRSELAEKTQQFRQKILFSTDRQASRRLFEETLKLIHHELVGKS